MQLSLMWRRLFHISTFQSQSHTSRATGMRLTAGFVSVQKNRNLVVRQQEIVKYAASLEKTGSQFKCATISIVIRCLSFANHHSLK